MSVFLTTPEKGNRLPVGDIVLCLNILFTIIELNELYWKGYIPEETMQWILSSYEGKHIYPMLQGAHEEIINKGYAAICFLME